MPETTPRRLVNSMNGPFPPLSLFEPSRTVAAVLHDSPTTPPKKAASRLFPKPWVGARFVRRFKIKRDLVKGRTWTPEELDEAAARGRFPHRPSDLFLQIYADVLTCLTRDPLAGNVSPPLIGTNGTIPLTIVSTIPDIMRHYHDCIVLAEKEVFLVTNYWQPSNSTGAIHDALIALSARVQKRGGPKVVVKIMWDRGAFVQLVKNHASVNEKTWTGLNVPAKSEIPYLDVQIINFHRPLLGTFHQKAMVVDRKVALLNSNNIQDRPNIEMMVHLEGPVVDSIYDVLLLSWHEKLTPALPCSVLSPEYPHEGDHDYLFTDENPYLAEIDVAKAARAARKLLKRQNDRNRRLASEHHQHLHRSWWRQNSYDGSDSTTPTRQPTITTQGATTLTSSGGFSSLVSHLVEMAREEKSRIMGGGGGAENQGENYNSSNNKPSMNDDSWPAPSSPSPQENSSSGGAETPTSADVNRASERQTASAPTTIETSTNVPAVTVEEPNFSSSSEKVTISDSNDHLATTPLEAPVTPATANLEKASSSIESSPSTKVADDSSPTQGANVVTKSRSAANERLKPETEHGGAPVEATASYTDLRFSKLSTTHGRLRALSSALNAGALSQLDATIIDESLIHDFSPHVLHKAHKPFPIALVNRRPHGMPGHQDLRVPQNAAWLGGFRHAQKSVFIQTPTLNASPVVKAVLDACKTGGPDGKGIQVTLFLDLGFNDKGESVPFQGGTNEEVVFRLYKDLRLAGKEQNLHVFWYTGKDQVKPVNAVHKTRNCHVKFMAIDGQCAIVGNGNQDTQSWFHSQECNILIDDPIVVQTWLEMLRTNQSTHAYGRVDTDGVWRDPSTKEPLQAPKSVSCFSAIWAMI